MPVAIVSVVVPPSGDGPIANISALVGPKTVTLSGFFQGSYTLLASHNGANFVPVLLFDSDGLESIKLTLSDAYAQVRIRANTSQLNNVACEVSGISSPGENLFAPLATFPPGAGGTSGIVDLAALFPPTGLEENFNIICEGGFDGVVIVDGSNDGSNFNNLGIFRGSSQQRPLIGLTPLLEFAPLSSGDNVRYLRVTVQGTVTSQVTLTVGGSIKVVNVGTGSAVVLDDSSAKSAIENGTSVSTEVILYEWEKPNFNTLPANIVAQLGAIVRAISSQEFPSVTGIIRVYIGATNPGDTTGAMLVLTVPGITNFLDAPIDVTSAPFINPGGNNLVQVTGEVSAPMAASPSYSELAVRGIVLSIG